MLHFKSLSLTQVKELSERHADVVPNYGLHPWSDISNRHSYCLSKIPLVNASQPILNDADYTTYAVLAVALLNLMQIDICCLRLQME